MHAFAVVLMARAMHLAGRSGFWGAAFRRPVLLPTLLVGATGLLLGGLHGVESAVWALAYLALGAEDTARDAILYSVASMTGRGASGIEPGAHWKMLGALEGMDSILLFGISTAFAVAVVQEVMTLVTLLHPSLPRWETKAGS